MTNRANNITLDTLTQSLLPWVMFTANSNRGSNSATWHASMAIHSMTTHDISIYLSVYHSNYRVTLIRLWVSKQNSYSYFAFTARVVPYLGDTTWSIWWDTDRLGICPHGTNVMDFNRISNGCLKCSVLSSSWAKMIWKMSIWAPPFQIGREKRTTML